jgi:endonuclease/exonuclease/phosphatase family metal-dependent hydrolase
MTSVPSWPHDTSGAPPVVGEDVARLRVALDTVVPPRDEQNILVATWNVRAFGELTPKWQSSPSDAPKRDWRSVACIAEVVSRFDVVALQEVRRSPSALRFLLQLLGPHWRAIASDVTEGDPGNSERLAFVYDSTRLQPAGLVGEIVLPGTLGGQGQFARTPYVAGFTRGDVEFVLTTVHVLWGENEQARLPEISSFARWMREWADRPMDWNQNLLVLGDFNLDRVGDPLFEAFVSTGLFPPAELNNVPRTVFEDDGEHHFYDQIAWFSDPSGASLLDSMTYSGRGGSFDFVPHAFQELSLTETTWRMSDHYPLWVEFRT